MACQPLSHVRACTTAVMATNSALPPPAFITACGAHTPHHTTTSRAHSDSQLRGVEVRKRSSARARKRAAHLPVVEHGADQVRRHRDGVAVAGHVQLLMLMLLLMRVRRHHGHRRRGRGVRATGRRLRRRRSGGRCERAAGRGASGRVGGAAVVRRALVARLHHALKCLRRKLHHERLSGRSPTAGRSAWPHKPPPPPPDVARQQRPRPNRSSLAAHNRQRVTSQACLHFMLNAPGS